MYELPKVRIAMVKESTIISDCQITTKRDIQRLIQEQLDYSDREIFGGCTAKLEYREHWES